MDNNKKIKIITITGESNYGNSLQNYAVIKVLSKLGFKCETVKTNYEPDLKPNSKYKIKQYAKVLLNHNDYMYFLRKLNFYKFNKKYLHKSKDFVNETSVNKIDDCDALVFGSDQIWNFTMGRRIREGFVYFTGGFSQNIPKIAYSASIGADYIPQELQNSFVDNITSFKAVSVREEKAKDIINNLTDKEVTVTLDPTMMLDKSEWLEISKKPKFAYKKDKFILTYFLGEKTEQTNDLIDKTAREKGLKVINLYNERCPIEKISDPNHFVTNPSEFIWLVANCEIIFTDSFHGSVFSVIMEKPFRCMDRIEAGQCNMSSRMDTLFKKFGIEAWCKNTDCTSADDLFYKDYSEVANVLQAEREHAISFLKGALDFYEAEQK